MLDPTGDRGLKWNTFNDPEVKMKKFPIMSKETEICNNPLGDPENYVDTRCQDTFVKYLEDVWYQGIAVNESNKIKQSIWEYNNDAIISNEFKGRCMYILINKTRTPACQVVYIRHARGKKRNGKDMDSYFEYFEVQLYNRVKESFQLRYAYWNQEDLEKLRDMIFLGD